MEKKKNIDFEHGFCNPIVKSMCFYITIHINESSIVFWYIVQYMSLKLHCNLNNFALDVNLKLSNVMHIKIGPLTNPLGS